MILAVQRLSLQMKENFGQLEGEIQELQKETKELKYITQTKLVSSSIKEKTEIGRTALEHLKNINSITAFVPTDGESVLEEHEYSDAQHMKEQVLVDCILKKLQHIVKPRVVVSSDFPWLMTSSNVDQDKQKPDAFITHRATFTRRDSSRQVDCGVPAHRAFYQGLGIVDFKVNRDNKAFGELIVHD